MEGNKVQRNGATGCRAGPFGTVFQKCLQIMSGVAARWPGSRRTTNARVRQRAPYASRGVVIKTVVVFLRAFPIANVRLIPDFQLPRGHFVLAVTLLQMFGQRVDQILPALVIFRRIAPSRIGDVTGKRSPVRIGPGGQSLWRKAD